MGALAIGVLAVTLPAGERVGRRIDYGGAALLAGSLSALILLTSLGGNSYPWGSPFIVAMGVAAVALLAAFVFVERRAVEPLLPPALLRNSVVVTTGVVGLIVGFALLGSVTYLPTFLQIVNGITPTDSGLALLPLMGGMLTMSILTGQIVTRTRRYKPFPILGTAVMTVGLYLLSTMNEHSSRATEILFMAVLGVGLGMVMQVLVLAAQNAVPYELLGVATSSATLFRLIGSALGTAVLGAVFSNRLSSALDTLLPPAARAVGLNGGSVNPRQLDTLPQSVRIPFIHAFTQSLDTVFLVAAGVGAMAFVISWLIKQLPLRETVTTTGVAESLAAPTDRDSLTEITRAVGVLLGRDAVKETIYHSAAESGAAMGPRAAFALVLVARDPRIDLERFARRRGIAAGILPAGLRELRERGLLAPESCELTAAGRAALECLVAARSSRIASLLDGWCPDHHDQVGQLLSRLAREVTAPAPT